MSARCESLQAKVWRIKKEEFNKIKTISEDGWNEMIAKTQLEQEKFYNLYADKLKNTQELNCNSSG